MISVDPASVPLLPSGAAAAECSCSAGVGAGGDNSTTTTTSSSTAATPAATDCGAGGMMRHVTSSEACVVDAAAVAERLRTDPERGLTNAEAARRRQYHGHNDFSIAEEEPLWKKYIGQVGARQTMHQCIILPRGYICWNFCRQIGYTSGLNTKNSPVVWDNQILSCCQTAQASVNI